MSGGDGVYIELLGRLRVYAEGRCVERFPTKKVAGLLSALTFDRSLPLRREWLVAELWPNADEESGRANLRQALFLLRQLMAQNHLPSNLIWANRTLVGVDPARIETDVARFQRMLDGEPDATGALAAIELYRGPLLQEFDEAWIWPHRSRLEESYVQLLTRQAESLNEQGDFGGALELGRRARQTDPLSEAANLATIRALVGLDRRTDAQRQLREFDIRFKAELGSGLGVTFIERVETILNEQGSALVPHPRRSPMTFIQPSLHGGSASGAPVLPRPSWSALSRWQATRRRFVGTVGPAVACVLMLSAALRPSGQPAARPIASPQGRISQGEPGAALVDPYMPAHSPGAILAVEQISDAAWKAWYGPNEKTFIGRLAQNSILVDQTLDWTLRTDPKAALLISGDLVRYWLLTGQLDKAKTKLRQALRENPDRTENRARALVGLDLAIVQSGGIWSHEPDRCLQEALDIYRRSADQWGVAHTLRHMGLTYGWRRQIGPAKRCYSEALSLFRRTRNVPGQAVTMLCLSFLWPGHGSAASAHESADYALEALRLFRSIGNEWGVSSSREAARILKDRGLLTSEQVTRLDGLESALTSPSRQFSTAL